MNMLTKTEYLIYKECPKCLWLKKNRPDAYVEPKWSEFAIDLIKQGYEVEKYAKGLFPNADSQKTFKTKRGLEVRVDFLEENEDGTYNLYEVKSSTKVDKYHLLDVTFQVIALEEAGIKLNEINIVLLDRDYVKDGEINVHQLFRKEDVIEKVARLRPEVEQDIDLTLKLLAKTDIDESGCSCYTKTRSNCCSMYEYFNGKMSPTGIWNLNRISEKKLNILLDMGIKDISELNGEIELSTLQEMHTKAVKTNKPFVDEDAIREEIGKLKFPLSFFDYETISTAIPRIDGTSPYEKIPFQYSLHILHQNGELEHKEFLATSLEERENLLKQLKKDTPTEGSVVSWNMSFEKSINKGLAEKFDEYRDILIDMNERMVDFEDYFKDKYYDKRFLGYTSIKKILPVICPSLSYADLDVKDGTDAMKTFEEYIDSKDANLRESLLEYCKLDTFAMVEIYRFLKEI